MIRDVRLATGQRLRVDLRDWCGALYLNPGAIEPVTTRFLRGALRPGDVFVDVGANVGYFAILAGGWVGPAGRVIAVEPNPTLADLLTASVRLNMLEGVVAPVRQAVAEVGGEQAPLYLSNDSGNTGLSSLTPSSGHLQSGTLSAGNAINVTTTTLSELAKVHNLNRLDVLKIDVEGAEERVWAGATDVLQRLRPRFIICESHLDGPVSQDARRLGYTVEMLEPLDPGGTWGNLLLCNKT